MGSRRPTVGRQAVPWTAASSLPSSSSASPLAVSSLSAQTQTRSRLTSPGYGELRVGSKFSNRRKREIVTGLSVLSNFEILRRRYLDSMERARLRANQRKRSQIQQNQSFLQNIG